MSIPDDLVLLEDVAARLPGKSVSDLRRMSRRRQFPDVMKVGNNLYVRGADLDVWQRGCWQQVQQEIADARLRHAGLPPIWNRRAKRQAVQA